MLCLHSTVLRLKLQTIQLMMKNSRIFKFSMQKVQIILKTTLISFRAQQKSIIESVVRDANFSSMTLLKIHRLKCLSKVQFLHLLQASVCTENTSSHFNSIKLVIWYFGNCYADPLRAPTWHTHTHNNTTQDAIQLSINNAI